MLYNLKGVHTVTSFTNHDVSSITCAFIIDTRCKSWAVEGVTFFWNKNVIKIMKALSIFKIQIRQSYKLSLFCFSCLNKDLTNKYKNIYLSLSQLPSISTKPILQVHLLWRHTALAWHSLSTHFTGKTYFFNVLIQSIYVIT